MRTHSEYKVHVLGRIAVQWMLLAGWLHYLAFDLLIGTWEARDSADRDVPRWILIPCLFLTFMFGPTGWLIYMGARSRFPGNLSVRSRG